MIMLWERYCNASPKPEFFFYFFVYSFIHISAKYESVWVEILHRETSKLMYNWPFPFVVLHQPTLLRPYLTGSGDELATSWRLGPQHSGDLSRELVAN